MRTYSPNTYYLADVHKEIDLYDRKIAHCRHCQVFALESERSSELGKLQRKRKTLVKLAMEFAEQGIEHNPKFLPRSFVVSASGKVTDAADQYEATSVASRSEGE